MGFLERKGWLADRIRGGRECLPLLMILQKMQEARWDAIVRLSEWRYWVVPCQSSLPLFFSALTLLFATDHLSFLLLLPLPYTLCFSLYTQPPTLPFCPSCSPSSLPPFSPSPPVRSRLLFFLRVSFPSFCLCTKPAVSSKVAFATNVTCTRNYTVVAGPFTSFLYTLRSRR